MPALKKAIESSNKIVCVNNLKTLGYAFQYYSNDFNDYMPPCRITDWNAPWTWGISPVSQYWGDTYLIDGRGYVNGENTEVTNCPSQEARTQHWQFAPYGYNLRIGPDLNDANHVWRKRQQLSNPSKLIVITDCYGERWSDGSGSYPGFHASEYGDGAGGALSDSLNSLGSFYNYAKRHLSYANISFADLHVGSSNEFKLDSVGKILTAYPDSNTLDPNW